MRSFLSIIVCIASIAGLCDSSQADLLSPGDFTSLGTLDLSSGNITIDTDALTITGAVNFNGVADNQGGTADSFGGVSGPLGIPEVAVFTFDDIILTGTTSITVTGTRALALLSQGDATIDVLISVSGTSGIMDNPSPNIYPGGPGGFAGGLGANDGVGPGGGGFSVGEAVQFQSTRGASGSFGSEGRNGDGGVTAGMARPTYGNLISALQGGSGGGGGKGSVAGGNFAAGGGGGGGALEVGAAGSVTIGVNGALEANGGAGDFNFDFFGDVTGGGGSGGGIRVHGSQIDNQGEIRARSLSNSFDLPGGGGRVLVSGSPLGIFFVGMPVDLSVQAGVDVSPASAGMNHGVLTITPNLTVVPGGEVYGFSTGIVAQTASTTQPQIDLFTRDLQVLSNGQLTVAAGGHTNGYSITLQDTLASITGAGTLTNQGELRGSGSVQVTLVNASGGEINAINDTLVFTEAVTNNAGAQINAIGSTLDFQSGLTNSGDIRLFDSTIMGSMSSSETVLAVSADGISEISGVIQGSGVALSKQGAGILVLSAANTYSGGTNIQQGTLRVGGDQVIPAGTVIVQAGSTLDLTGHTETIGPGGVVATGLELSSDAQVQVGNLLFISTLGTFIDYNSGATPSGALIGSGTLSLGTSSATRTISVADNPAASDDLHISSTISNSPTNPDSSTPVVDKQGAGRLTLSGNNTFWRGVKLSEGIIRVQSNGALGNGVDTANTGTNVLGGATLELEGSVNVAAEHLTLAGDGVGGIGALRSVSGTNNWGGQVELSADSKIEVDAGSLLVGGNISGSFGLTKSGPGTLILNGMNTYSGGTTIDDGTLGGNGSITGSVTVNSGGTLAPGNSVGILTLDDVDFNAGSTLAVELAGSGGVAGIDFDQLAVNNSAILGGILDLSLIDLGGGVFSPSAGDTFEIITATTGISGVFDTVNWPTLTGDLMWYLNYGATSVELVSTYAADFDEDGFVDDLDFAAWESNFGNTSATHMTGDANADAAADGFDFLKWQQQFGMPAVIPASASTVTIPEPSTLVLAGMSSLLLCSRRRQRGHFRRLRDTQFC